MRGFSKHLLSVRLGGVSGSQADTNFLGTIREIILGYFLERTYEVTLDIVGEGFDRRNINCVNLFL